MAADPADRIETALARIEAAGAAKSYSLERIQQRHAKLRTRVEDNVAALDSLMVREDAPDAD